MDIKLGNEYIIPYFSDAMKFIPKNEEKKSMRMEKGGVYSLPTEECDGFTIPQKKYKCIGEIDEIDGVDLNSVIVKQVDGKRSSIFSLTKNDCRKLNVEFEPGLQLFPKSLNWSRCDEAYDKDEEYVFDSQNLSTYPTDFYTKTIRRITLKLSRFYKLYDYIHLPNGSGIKICSFSDQLVVQTKRDIGEPSDVSNLYVPKNSRIRFKIVTRCLSRTNNDIVDEDGNVFIELNFDAKINKNLVGIHPKCFENKPFEEFFDIIFLEQSKFGHLRFN